ncbi:hypothetical protein VNO78_35139 [Psophocarpus tetragonolobus]|uniref:Uncharacterized protein n=1 Tax=Psophocarpus tetragonolobus TaxID=3891 RepID=A0AAN9RLP9_PSOTE
MPSPNLKIEVEHKKKQKRSNSLSARRGTARLRMRSGVVFQARIERSKGVCNLERWPSLFDECGIEVRFIWKRGGIGGDRWIFLKHIYLEAKRLLGIFDLVKEPGNHPVFVSPAAAEERQRSRLEECFFLVKRPGKRIPFRWMLWIEELQFLHPYLFGAREAESPILGGTDFFKPGKNLVLFKKNRQPVYQRDTQVKRAVLFSSGEALLFLKERKRDSCLDVEIRGLYPIHAAKSICGGTNSIKKIYICLLRALGLLHWGSLPLEPGMTVYFFFFTDSIPMKIVDEHEAEPSEHTERRIKQRKKEGKHRMECGKRAYRSLLWIFPLNSGPSYSMGMRT